MNGRLPSSASRSRCSLGAAAWTALATVLTACGHAPAGRPAEVRARNDDAVVADVAQSARRFVPVRLPSARHGHRLHDLGGELIVFGGYAAGSRADDRGTRETWRLARGEESWRRAADLPSGQSFGSSAIVDGDVYAIGGDVARYDAQRDVWERVSATGTMPDSHFGATAAGQRIVVLGGFPAQLGGALAFDVRMHGVVDLPEPPGFAPGDHFHVLATLAGEVHVVGGLLGATYEASDQHWVLDGDVWRAAPRPPRGVFAKFSVQQVVGDALYVFDPDGGLCFDARARTWTPRAKTPVLFVMPASCALDGKLWVVGGVYGADEQELWTYDLARDVWSPAE